MKVIKNAVSVIVLLAFLLVISKEFSFLYHLFKNQYSFGYWKMFLIFPVIFIIVALIIAMSIEYLTRKIKIVTNLLSFYFIFLLFLSSIISLSLIHLFKNMIIKCLV